MAHAEELAFSLFDGQGFLMRYGAVEARSLSFMDGDNAELVKRIDSDADVWQYGQGTNAECERNVNLISQCGPSGTRGQDYIPEELCSIAGGVMVTITVVCEAKVPAVKG